MPLIFTLSTPTNIPLEVDAIHLDAVCKLSPDEVKRIEIQHGNQVVPVGEFFDVTGSAEDGEIRWHGDCSRVKLIGAHHSNGRIVVDGNAGMHLGAEMTGGEIVVNGNAGDWVGAEMHGGRIRIHGNAGHLVGAVYRGGRRGMTGGEILIDGDAGNEIGHSMRRGLIAIGGRSGDAAGFAMQAGTILLFGECGIRLGAGMIRGTIGLFGPSPPPMLPTFRYACTYQPTFLRVYLTQLARWHFVIPDDWISARYRRYCGDFLELGRGEILIREWN